MARLKTLGFEYNENPTALSEFTSYSTGGIEISTTTVRSGNYSGWFRNPTSGTGMYAGYQFSNANSTATFYMRGYLYITTLPTVASAVGGWYDSLNNDGGGLQLQTNGALKQYDNAGVVCATSSVLNLNQWYCIEVRYGTSAVELRLNGIVQGTNAAATTTGVFSYRWGDNVDNDLNTVGEWFWDDLAINDATGTIQNSYPGPGKVVRLKPNAAGSINTFATQTGGTAGSANNFTRVNEVTPDDATSLNGSNVLNQEDLFEMQDVTGVGEVSVVAVEARFRNNVADATTALKLEIAKVTGGTKTQSAALIPNSTTFQTNTAAGAIPQTPPIVLYVDPNGNPWNARTINSMQAGYLISTGGTNRVEVTSLSVIVDYNPTSKPIGYSRNNIRPRPFAPGFAR